MFPSIETIGIGLVITAILAILDWYVWRTAPVLPYPITATEPRRVEEEDEAAAFEKVA